MALTDRLTGLLGKFPENLRIPDRNVCQGFSVQLDTRLSKTVHKLAVRQFVHFGSGCDPNDPQAAAYTLLLTAIPVCVSQTKNLLATLKSLMTAFYS
jgi:hypothetical protein